MEMRRKNVEQFKGKITIMLEAKLLWSKSTAKFFAEMVCGMIKGGKIWLKKMAQASEIEENEESIVRRLQRLLNSNLISYHDFSKMLKNFSGAGKKKLIIDRTDWQFGKKAINIFVCAVIVEAIGKTQSFAAPLVWHVFDKKGTSSSKEQIALIKDALHVLNKDEIEVVLGDREFIGNEWLQFLHEEQIPFIVRIRNNMFVKYEGERVNAFFLVSSVKKGKTISLHVHIGSIPVRLEATRSATDELVIVIASLNAPHYLLAEYKRRWLIELFFKSAKSQGFQLEDTHITDPARIKALFAILALASFCCILAGIVKDHCKKIPIKKHGRPAFSLFTYGLDFLITFFRNTKPIPHLPKLSSPSPLVFLFSSGSSS